MKKSNSDSDILPEIIRALEGFDYKKAETVSQTIDLLKLEKRYRSLIRNQEKELKRHQWVKLQFLQISNVIQDGKQIDSLVQKTLALITPLLEACSSAFYLLEQWSEGEAPFLRQIASYATPEQETTFALGEGFVGQCAHDQRLLHIKKLPKHYLKFRSATGSASASSLLLIPIVHENKLKGVFEIASFEKFKEEQIDFLTQTVSALASKMNSIEARKTVNELLLKSHKYNNTIKEHNEQLLSIKRKLEQTNRQVREASRYKSEFLANMSHELRTPLNSLLLLSKKLAQNTYKNLNSKEVEYAEVISKSGQDLLILINDILDLSKIESGKMSINPAPVSLLTTIQAIQGLFEEVALKKNLLFEMHLSQRVPEIIQTDPLRLEQILRNFLTNAFKFTHKGKVTLSVDVLENTDCLRSTKLQKKGAIAFKVQDTGIGIEKEKLDLVFESFQQADGSTSRQYGGTGLGLSISRELSKLLEGEVHISSTVGEGSSFTLYIPALAVDMALNAPSPLLSSSLNTVDSEQDRSRQFEEAICSDDRHHLKKGKPFVLVLEDEPVLAALIVKYIQTNGGLAFVTPKAQEAIQVATDYKPSGIIIDLNLSRMAGKAAEIKLKGMSNTGSIPLMTFSKPNDSFSVLSQSLASVILAPLEAAELNVALKNFQRLSPAAFKTAQILGKNKKHFKVLKDSKIKGIFIDSLRDIKMIDHSFLILDMASHKLEELLKLEKTPLPLLILAKKNLSLDEKSILNQYASSFLASIREGKDLVDEMVSKFLTKALPQKTQKKVETLVPKMSFQKRLCKNVLIVDDDMRNIFALSAVLENQGLNIIEATNGPEALEILSKNATIDMVLMDIMMPGLDGYRVMEFIRNNKVDSYLPVIAMSGKAMKEDRQKALESGADEFMSKPLDPEELLSVMAFWFKKQQYAS